MAKVWIDKEESYSPYISEEKVYGGFPVEIPYDKLDWIRRVEKEAGEVDEYLRQLFAEAEKGE